MGLFGSDRANAANKHIKYSGTGRAEDWIADSGYRENFAVLGGTQDQRAIAVDQGIARCFGKIGVVVIHNNDYLEQMLLAFRENHAPVYQQYENTPVCFVNNRNLCYEPLLGLDVSRGIEAIYPEELVTGTMNMQQQHLSSNALMYYFRIMEQRNVPITLDNLLYLCKMDLAELDRRELSVLPENVAGEILSALSQENICRQVRADVESFATQMDGRIWNRMAPATNVSIIEAVKRNGFISIRVPGNNNTISNYFACEIMSLINNNYTFLLVIDSVNIGQSLLKKVIVNSSSYMSFILAGGSIVEINGAEATDHSSLLNNCHEVLLFQSPNVIVAKLYSEMIGEYLRKFESSSENKHRGAFDLFSGRGSGTSVTEQSYARIRPEELVQLGEGAVLIDQVDGSIRVVRKFI